THGYLGRGFVNINRCKVVKMNPEPAEPTPDFTTMPGKVDSDPFTPEGCSAPSPVFPI
ncbi:hypothetical protein AVEN_217099-1, partial [Araneus ventricosus]